MTTPKPTTFHRRAVLAAALLGIAAAIGCNESSATKAQAKPNAAQAARAPEIAAPPQIVPPPQSSPPPIALNPIRPEADRLPKLQLEPLTPGTPPLNLRALEGKVLLVNFWGTWCPPCRREFPHLVELRRKYQNEPGFALISVSCSYGDDVLATLRDETAAFLSANNDDGPVYADLKYATRAEIHSKIGRVAYPMTLIVDRRGIVAFKVTGFGPDSIRQFEETINALLKEPVPAKSKSPS